MMKKQAAALVLALCVTLTGCGREEEKAGSLLGQAAGLEDDEILLVVGGREIPAWRYLYWLAADCRELEERCAAAGTALDWNIPLPEGGALRDLVKADALADTALYAAVESWAETYGCILTDAEISALPEGEDPYLTEEQGRNLAAVGREYAKLCALCRTPGSPLALTEEERKQFEEEAGLLAAERILIPVTDSRDAARQQAASLFARVDGAEDPDDAFAAVLAETGGGAMADADWTDPLRAAVSALKPGQISGIIETEEGFSVLRRLLPDPATVREAYLDSRLREAARNCEVRGTDAYDALDPEVFWNAVKGSAAPGK